MSHRDESAELEGLEPVERLLARFAPVGPPAAMRQRVLETAAAASIRRRRRIALPAYRLAVAAGLVAAVWLHLAADRVLVRTARQTGDAQVVWTDPAEQAAQLLDGDGGGRLYVAMALRAEAAWASPWPTAVAEDSPTYPTP